MKDWIATFILTTTLLAILTAIVAMFYDIFTTDLKSSLIVIGGISWVVGIFWSICTISRR
jgi:hypothetical protein